MKILVSALAALLLNSAPAEASVKPSNLALIKLPPGFSISVFTDQVPNARAMALSPGGVLYVGTFEAGKVYAVKNGKVFTIASGLHLPVGVAYLDGALYVSAVSRILRFDDIDNRLDAPPKPVIVVDSLPTEEHHGWKFIRFSPDHKWLYVPVGAPCNVCLKDDPRYASIMRMHPDGSGLEVYARGIRNSVGFDWDPASGDLWFTSNGRDNMGDDVPPDQLDRAPGAGLHFGFPFCHGRGVPDPEFGKQRACAEFTEPTLELQAHVAPLGMRFYTGSVFPHDYRDAIFIAEHGSWNRSKKIGYRIEVVRVAEGKVLGHEIFAQGWLQGETAWGRPVDVQQTTDGSLLVSDDVAGAVYKISYKEKR